MSFRTDEAQLLIVSFRPLAPLRRFVDPLLFRFVTLLFGLVHRRWLVLCWAIHGVEEQRDGTGIEEVMVRPRRNNDEIAGFYVLFFAADDGFAGAGSKIQDLVNCVYLWRVSFPVRSESSVFITSSPISPLTGTFMSTSCEYRPVHNTRRNSGLSEGKDVVICGK